MRGLKKWKYSYVFIAVIAIMPDWCLSGKELLLNMDTNISNYSSAKYGILTQIVNDGLGGYLYG
jgi:hypothetical protein